MQRQNGYLVNKYVNRKDIKNHILTETEEQLGGGETGFGVYEIQPHIDEAATFKFNTGGCTLEYRLPAAKKGREFTFIVGDTDAEVVIRTMDTDAELADSTGEFITYVDEDMKAIHCSAKGSLITLRCMQEAYTDEADVEQPSIWACVNAIGTWAALLTYTT